MRCSVLLSVCVLLIPLSGCREFGSNRVVGSGNVVTEAPDVGEFDTVEMTGAFRVVVSVGDAPSLTITTDDNIQPLILTSVDSGKLTIHMTEKVKPSDAIDIRITTPSLSASTSIGAIKATIEGITGEAFEARLEGAGSVTATGKVDTLTIQIDGAGHVAALGLEATSVHVVMSGAGSVETFAVEALDVELNGLGAVRYKGDPQVTKRISGLGTVIKE